MAITTITLVAAAVADIYLAMVAVMAALVEAVVALRRLVLLAQVEVLPVTLVPLERLELVVQTAVQAEQIQVAVQAQEIPLTQAQLETAVLELSFFVTLALSVAQAERSHHPAGTQFTHLLLQGHL
jgi:hypothetical protein